ncbi:phosphoribosylanthranilate isomerase [Telmatocola sphagniphila]|uniref:N-(5'-phosphoribosyl)anthranilate isomerase n=1 Tax=Telmatocola sphagniphila TaxID=1123043 RepID=A0A8E6B647_9BACT|nr:phosphoribosylanthranilate isomerase [Telmatocola sphagniphila]QVL32446.1 phosphoribosylanthranilate isomerase [Telmatocola sphagniphila]
MLRIKICGVTRPEDLALCSEAGADMVGINFYAKSPRFVDPRIALHLLKNSPPWLSTVGVFVDHTLKQACALAYQLGLRSIQWYGTVADPTDPIPFAFIPSFRIADENSLRQVEAYVQRCRGFGYSPSALLFDSHVQGALGGTGHKAPWDLIARWKSEIPIILAGGLTPENVAEAVRTVRPAGIDVASGVESSPGIKDAQKLQRFIETARSA